MILSAQSIAMRVGMLTPFFPRTVHNGMTYGLGPCGYDVRIAERVVLSPETPFVLASTLEHFDMPVDVMARVADKSSWARKGIACQNTVIEPGWRGFLTLELSIHVPDTEVTIEAGSPIAQIIFELLDKPTAIPYEGKYQDQRAGPVPAIEENGS